MIVPALETALFVPKGSPTHGLYLNENKKANGSKKAVPEAVGFEMPLRQWTPLN
jgi:hypothetical protein